MGEEAEVVREQSGLAEGQAPVQTHKPWQFKPGQSGNPTGRAKDPPTSKLLGDMRLVYRQKKGRDRGNGQAACRKLLEENPKEFLAQLGRLEAAHRVEKRTEAALKKSEEVAESVEADAGEAGLQELIAGLLGSYDAEPR